MIRAGKDFIEEGALGHIYNINDIGLMMEFLIAVSLLGCIGR